MERVEADLVADERATLTQSLDYQRATVVLKVTGLDEEQARRSPVPSGTSPLGLVRHLAGVERWWFSRCFAGEDVPWLYAGPDDWDADFQPGCDATLAEAVASYEAECRRSRAIVASASSLDTLAVRARRPQQPALRWVLVHMIEETARHNGHLDLLRELIDGTTGE